MLTDHSMNQTAGKLDRFVETLRERLFIPVGEARLTGCFQTTEPQNAIPADALYGPVPGRWGGEGVYAWFRMEYTVPDSLDGKPLFLWPRIGFYEGTLWVNGRIHSNYAAKFNVGSHGNHWCNRFCAGARAGESFRFDLECYAWHDMPGTQPLDDERMRDYSYPVDRTDVCVRDDEVMEFMFDLYTLLSLRRSLPAASLRRAEVENALYEAHLRLFYDPDACSEEEFRKGLRAAAPFLKEQLKKRNGDTAPWIGLIGHSHMDTAWLWPLTETEKKCARTYANTLNLMEEYPEYRFVQSSAFHSDWLRRDYPELFSRIQKAVADGRYEPNGGVWVECDCNLTGGEYLVRQFVWGQRFTRKYFSYTSDSFWLPDTFGYSSAIPQIMKGCGVDYFLTTKIAWNDTNEFPLTSFLWKGIDGTEVLTHFNRTHIGPNPESFRTETYGEDRMKELRTAPLRLFSFGKGDGGGGPEFEMLECARRLSDLEGAARSGYTSVSNFMKRLEKTIVNPTVYSGELYLELHRGTLTNQHVIKHNNRACEIALHNLELALVLKAVREGTAADESPVAPLMNTLLVHQFHDILPGTCIHSVHEETYASVGGAIRTAEELTARALSGAGADIRSGSDIRASEKTVSLLERGNPAVNEARNTVESYCSPTADTYCGETKRDCSLTLLNPVSFDRNDTLYLPGTFEGIASEGTAAATQVFTALDGTQTTAVRGLTLPAFTTAVLNITPAAAADCESPFILEGNRLTTPFAQVTFNENGAMSSFIDRRTGRELVQGLPFNTFLLTEDLPSSWDNWDFDADEEDKFAPAGELISREVVSEGTVELRIRSVWRLTEKTVITQDMVFDAASPLVTFDTIMDWRDDHRFLKAAFDTAIQADGVRNEIQFGYIRRSNARSTSIEKARFEVCNHKYSDLSEANGGVAILNDSKYGISVRGGSMRLSLHKGGCRPDDHGDKGIHVCRYALLPHDTPFGAESVIRPAYAFNYRPVIVERGSVSAASLCRVDDANVIIETVKPCEDTQKAYILRLYEAAGGYSRTHLTFSHPVKALFDCNMLEEELAPLDPAEPLVFTPFKIRTIKVVY